MNLLLGIMFGTLLTIGTAFFADAYTTANVTSDTCSKQIVNWDIAKERLHETLRQFRPAGIVSKAASGASRGAEARRSDIPLISLLFCATVSERDSE